MFTFKSNSILNIFLFIYKKFLYKWIVTAILAFYLTYVLKTHEQNKTVDIVWIIISKYINVKIK